MSDIPLGKTDSYQNSKELIYSPDLLFAIPRQANRELLGIKNEALPFIGCDRWNAFEFSWLNHNDIPQVAKLCIDVPCDSINIVESKSLKLYLNSLSFTSFENEQALLELLQRDLNKVTATKLTISLHNIEKLEQENFIKEHELGQCLDAYDVSTKSKQTINFNCVDADLLQHISNDKNHDSQTPKSQNKKEIIHSHLFRSLCPVTGQPDWASIVIAYEGMAVCHKSVLRYLLSYRNHQGFHENCVEQIYCDFLQSLQPEKLSVYAGFLRRGGIDINPFRSNFEQSIPFGRFTRQ